MSLETIIEMTPDADGVFKPSKVIKEDIEKKNKNEMKELKQQKKIKIEKFENIETKNMLDEFLEGFSIGNNIINQLRRQMR